MLIHINAEKKRNVDQLLARKEPPPATHVLLSWEARSGTGTGRCRRNGLQHFTQDTGTCRWPASPFGGSPPKTANRSSVGIDARPLPTTSKVAIQQQAQCQLSLSLRVVPNGTNTKCGSFRSTHLEPLDKTSAANIQVVERTVKRIHFVALDLPPGEGVADLPTIGTAVQSVQD